MNPTPTTPPAKTYVNEPALWLWLRFGTGELGAIRTSGVRSLPHSR